MCSETQKLHYTWAEPRRCWGRVKTARAGKGRDKTLPGGIQPVTTPLDPLELSIKLEEVQFGVGGTTFNRRGLNIVGMG